MGHLTLILLIATFPLLCHAQTQSFGVYRDPCGPGSDRPNTPCNPNLNLHCEPEQKGMCDCDVGFTQYKKSSHACANDAQNKLDPEATALFDEDCENAACVGTHSQCHIAIKPRKCICPQDKPAWNPVERDCVLVEPGGKCIDGAFVCKIHTEVACSNGHCPCQPEKPFWNGDKCAVKAPGTACATGVNDCGPNMECPDGKCQCITDFEWDAGTERCGKKLGGSCTNKEECLPNTVCKGSVCACATNYVINEETKRCDLKIVTIGGKCKVTDDCLPGKDLECATDKKKCACKADSGSEWSEGRCKAKSELTTCVPDAEVDTCDETGVTNLECDKEKKFCACPTGSDYSVTAKACKLLAGEDCTVNDAKDVEHGLCLSGRCGVTGTPTHGKCECADGAEGQRHIWASDPAECVVDKFGFSCENNDDCRFPTFKADRIGLVCEEKRCVCATGNNYQGAYCVKDVDSKDNGNTCDPKEVAPVCAVAGTGLSCKSVAEGGNKCSCLQKDVTHRSKSSARKFVLMEWDNAEMKCGLKAEGKDCGDGAECRSGRCASGKCEGSTPKTGGAKGVASGYAEVMMLLTSVIVVRQI